MKRKGEDEVDEKEEDGRMSPQRNLCARYVHHRTSKSRQTPSVSVYPTELEISCHSSKMKNVAAFKKSKLKL